MEELLNKLIEKGWKPFGTLGNVRNSVYTNKYFFFEGCADGVTLRQIVSKESGLWQFCVENGLVEKQHGYIDEMNWRKADDDEEGHDNGEQRYSREYQYRLIESALKDESELESFILENINIDE